MMHDANQHALGSSDLTSVHESIRERVRSERRSAQRLGLGIPAIILAFGLLSYHSLDESRQDPLRVSLIVVGAAAFVGIAIRVWWNAFRSRADAALAGDQSTAHQWVVSDARSRLRESKLDTVSQAVCAFIAAYFAFDHARDGSWVWAILLTLLALSLLAALYPAPTQTEEPERP